MENENKEYIMSLETRKMMIGNEEWQGKYDEETQTFYELNDNNELTGRKADVSRAQEEYVEYGEDEESYFPDLEDNQKNPNGILAKIKLSCQRLAGNPNIGKSTDKKVDKEKKPDKKQKWLIILVGCVALSVVVLALAGGGNNATPPVTDEGEIVNAEQGDVTVIQLTRDIIPGEQITENDIREQTISAESYNEITLGDSQLYQWDRHDSLLNKYVTAYIPKGQFLTYQNISATYNPPSNPWLDNMDGFELVSIPIPKDVLEDDRLLYGGVINLTLIKKTVNEADVTPEDKKYTGELEHEKRVEQSYILDTYKIDTTIVDFLDSNGDSLYPRFCAWNAIPVGEQTTYLKKQFKADKELNQKITPAFISIKVNKEQAEQLGSILSDDTDITYAFADQLNVSSEARKASAAQFKALFETIQQSKEIAQQELAQEGEEEK